MLRIVLVISVLYFADLGYGASLKLKPYNETAVIMFFGNDLNLDGYIDRSEMQQLSTFYDADGDGFQTRYEYTEYVCASDPALYQLSHYLFDEFDLNGDHILEVKDYHALFDNMDKDRDEKVVLGEFVAYWERIFPKYENVDLHLETLSHGPSSCH